MPKTIAIYIPTLGGGGAEAYMLRLARALKAKGYTILFVLSQKKGALLAGAEQEFEIVGLNAKRSLAGFFALIRFLKMRQPDVLLSSAAFLNLLAAIAVPLARVKTRLIMIEHAIVSYYMATEKWHKKWITPYLMRLLYPMADHVAAVSQAVADDLARMVRLKPGKVSVVANPVIDAGFAARAAEAPDHPWLTQHDKPVILAAGRLAAVKDFGTLLKAFVLLREKTDARLIILGDGALRQEFEAYIASHGLQDCVSLPGFRENVFPYLKAADLFVLTSLSESFAMVVAEALACGTPVVATDCGGPAEILGYGKFGRLVAMQNPKQLADAMLSALGKQHDVEALKARGLSYTAAKAADDYAGLIEA